MDPLEYYQSKAINSKRRRKLSEGCRDVRNAHNFIKSVVIGRHVHPGCKVLDVGCGSGGDLQKFAHAGVVEYVGLDSSTQALREASNRAAKIRSMRVEFREWDMCSPCSIIDLASFDVICCNFSIHYAFATVETARIVLDTLWARLKSGGVIFGCVPVGRESFVWKDTTLVGSAGTLREPSVTVYTLTDELRRAGFVLDLLLGFEDAYAWARGKAYDLCRKMMALEHGPDPNNVVFAASVGSKEEADRSLGQIVAW